jgi:hypothetical protein
LEDGLSSWPIPIIDKGEGKAKATGEGSKLRMISCDENRFGRKAARFPRTEDGLSCMRLFGYEDGQALAGSCRIGKAESELHAKLLCEGEELGTDLLIFKF